MSRTIFRFGHTAGSTAASLPEHQKAALNSQPKVVHTRRWGGLVLSVGLAVAAIPLLAPKPAFAWWRGGVYMGGPVYYAPRPVWGPPPVVYAAPPIVDGPPPVHWVPPHYNWRGFWIPGHWAP